MYNPQGNTNAIAGPSTLPDIISAPFDLDDFRWVAPGGSFDASLGIIGPRPKRKAFRSSRACLPCRGRRSKCASAPPGPCASCVENETRCEWPLKDGRSSRASARRRSTPRASSSSTSTSADGHIQAAEIGLVGALNPPLPVPAPSQQAFTWFDTSPTQQVPYADPSLAWAAASRLPTIQEGSVGDETTPSDTSPTDRPSSASARIVKITWWRPHGQTAIAPGLKRTTLRVRVDVPEQRWRSLSSDSRLGITSPGGGVKVLNDQGCPNSAIMRHLLDIFLLHFGCQYPFVERTVMEDMVEKGTGSVFLLNAIASVAARFSTHPAIAQAHLQPHQYGNVFSDQAKSMLGMMLGIPSRETVLALILLALASAGNDSESEVWILVGIAVRMSMDLGLHLEPEPGSHISARDRVLNRLLFWSVLWQDLVLCFGEGRRTTFRVDEITQSIPTEEDIRSLNPIPGSTTPSAFPYVAQQMLHYGPIINLLNAPHERDDVAIREAARADAVKHYNELPVELQWGVRNLESHCRANQGQIFIVLHLWMHTILTANASTVDPAAVLHSARTIGDILVLSDIIQPFAYLAVPFVNQPFYVAACLYINELERAQNPHGSTEHNLLLTNITRESIATLRQGLAKQAKYWSCVTRITHALDQHMHGTHDVDLSDITERISTVLSHPDRTRDEPLAEQAQDPSKTDHSETAWILLTKGSEDLLNWVLGRDAEDSQAGLLEKAVPFLTNLDWITSGHS